MNNSNILSYQGAGTSGYIGDGRATPIIPPAASPLDAALHSLAKNCTELRTAVAAMENRLTPVMRKQGPEKSNDALVDESPEVSLIVGAVRKRAYEIGEIIRLLEDFMARLEV